MSANKTPLLYLILFTFISVPVFSISTAQNMAEADSIIVTQNSETVQAINQRLAQLNSESVKNKISFGKQLELAAHIIRYDYAVLILVGLFIGLSTRKRALKKLSQNN